MSATYDDLPPLDPDAVLWSHPAEERAGRPLVLLLHGLGSHEGDLFGLVPAMPPEWTYASLRAPLVHGGGYAWFPLDVPGRPDPDIADAVATSVLAWLDAVGHDGPIIPMGFSQGGALTLRLLQLAPERFAAFVNLSGFVIPGTTIERADLAELARPVFWGRDLADPVIVESAIRRTQEWLPTRSALTERDYAGMLHGVSREELVDVVAFVRAALPA